MKEKGYGDGRGAATSLRIGVDATGIWGLKEDAPGGIITYTVEIINGILATDSRNQYLVYCFNEVPGRLLDTAPNVDFRIHRRWNRKVWQQLVLPLLGLRDRLDVMFYPSNSCSLFFPCRSVATVHDLQPYVIPEPFTRAHSSKVHATRWRALSNRWYWRLMLRVAAAKDHVLVPSECTKRDLERIFGTRAEKIHVIPEGVDTARFNRQGDVEFNRDEFLARFELPKRYILCVGTHAYKNLAGSVRAFDTVRRQIRQPIHLVVAGTTRPLEDAVVNLIEELGLEERVVFTGYFPDEQLGHLYRCAELLLFPSFYEGFGLPVLEAFACGTPVVASNRGSLPEVAGDAAVLVDPNDPDQIAAGVLKILNEPGIRAENQRRGLDRVRQFTWSTAGRRTVDVLRQAASASA